MGAQPGASACMAGGGRASGAPAGGAGGAPCAGPGAPFSLTSFAITILNGPLAKAGGAVPGAANPGGASAGAPAAAACAAARWCRSARFSADRCCTRPARQRTRVAAARHGGLPRADLRILANQQGTHDKL